MVRLQKFLADAGVASRRASEALIQAGRVEVNGQPLTQLGIRVDPRSDVVMVDGRQVQPLRKRYVAVHKPPGVVCTCRDERDRPVLGDLLPTDWQGMVPVGRLDQDSEGLIFATNDGAFALRITHPRYGVPKVYQAEVAGEVRPAMLRSFTRGVRHLGELLRARAARLVQRGKRRSVVELELLEGKNREVRRLFAAQDLTVTRLCRVQIGAIALGELKPGRWRALTETEIKTLLKQS